jgi:hypothetical protein
MLMDMGVAWEDAFMLRVSPEGWPSQLDDPVSDSASLTTKMAKVHFNLLSNLALLGDVSTKHPN